MAAFLIYARHDIIDEAKPRKYAELVVPQIRAFGGEIVVARAPAQALEGAWQPKSITIIRFENKEALMSWYHSTEYAPLLQMRMESNTGDVIVIEET
jgi:uncharacterized protein (DUF1330 family)